MGGGESPLIDVGDIIFHLSRRQQRLCHQKPSTLIQRLRSSKATPAAASGMFNLAGFLKVTDNVFTSAREIAANGLSASTDLGFPH